MDSRKIKISFFIYGGYIIVGYLLDNIDKDIKGVSILYDGDIYHRLTTWDGFVLQEIEYDDLIEHINRFEVDGSDSAISEYKKQRKKLKSFTILQKQMNNTRVKLYISKCKELIVIGCEVKYFKCIILHHPNHQKFYEEFDIWALNINRFNETNFETIKNLNLIDVKKVSIIEKILGIEDEVKDDNQIIETCTSC